MTAPCRALTAGLLALLAMAPLAGCGATTRVSDRSAVTKDVTDALTSIDSASCTLTRHMTRRFIRQATFGIPGVLKSVPIAMTSCVLKDLRSRGRPLLLALVANDQLRIGRLLGEARLDCSASLTA